MMCITCNSNTLGWSSSIMQHLVISYFITLSLFSYSEVTFNKAQTRDGNSFKAINFLSREHKQRVGVVTSQEPDQSKNGTEIDLRLSPRDTLSRYNLIYLLPPCYHYRALVLFMSTKILLRHDLLSAQIDKKPFLPPRT